MTTPKFLFIVIFFTTISTLYAHAQSWQSYDSLYRVNIHAGNYEKASAYAQKAMKEADKSLSKNDTLRINLLKNIFDAESHLGRHKNALNYSKKRLAVIKEILGSENLIYTSCLEDMAYTCNETKEYDAAVRYLTEARETVVKIKGEQSEENADICKSIGTIYRNINQPYTAKVWYDIELEIRSKIKENDMLAYAESCNRMAALYSVIGGGINLKNAERLLLEAVAVYEKELGAKHENYQLVVGNIISLYNNSTFRGSQYLKIMETWIKIQAADSIELVLLKTDLAQAYFEKSDYEYKSTWSRLVSDTRPLLEINYKTDQQRLVISSFLLTFYHYYEQNYDTAMHYCKEAIEIDNANPSIFISSRKNDLYKIAAYLYDYYRDYENATDYLLKSQGFSNRVAYKNGSNSRLYNSIEYLEVYRKTQNHNFSVQYSDLFYGNIVAAKLYIAKAEGHSATNKIDYYKNSLRCLQESLDRLVDQLKHSTSAEDRALIESVKNEYLLPIELIYDSIVQMNIIQGKGNYIDEIYETRAKYYESMEFDSIAAVYYNISIELKDTYFDYLGEARMYIKLFQLDKKKNPNNPDINYLKKAESFIGKSPCELDMITEAYSMVSEQYLIMGDLRNSIRLGALCGVGIIDYSDMFFRLNDDTMRNEERMLVEDFDEKLISSIYGETATASDSIDFYLVAGTFLMNEGDMFESDYALKTCAGICKKTNDIISLGVINKIFEDGYSGNSLPRKTITANNKDFTKLYYSIDDTWYKLYEENNLNKAIDTLFYISQQGRKQNYYSSVSSNYCNIADLLVEQKKFDEAMIFADFAISFAEQDWDDSSLGMAYYTKANILESQGKHGEAIEMADEALSFCSPNYDAWTMADICRFISGIYVSAYNNYDIALSYAMDCLLYAEKAKDIELEFAAYLDIAGMYYEMDAPDFESSLEFIRKAEKIQSKVKDPALNLFFHETWAYYHYNTGETAKAIEEIKLIVSEENNVTDFHYESVYNLYGVILKYSGNLTDALTAFDKGIVWSEKNNNKALFASSCNHKAWIYIRMGDYEKALELHEKAFAIQKEENDYENMAYSLINISGIYVDQNNYIKTKEYLLRSIEISEAYELAGSLSNAYQNLAEVYSAEGNYELALTYLDLAYGIISESKDNRALSWIFESYGRVHFEMQNWEKAIEYFRQSIAMAKQTNMFYGNYSSSNLIAECYLHLNMLANAKQYSDMAYEETVSRNEPEAHYQCALVRKKIASAENDWEEADSYLSTINDYNLKLLFSNFAIMSEQEQEQYFKKEIENYNDYYSYVYFRKSQKPELTAQVCNNILMNKGILLKSSTAMRNAVLNSGDTSLVKSYYKWLLNKNIIAEKYAAGEDVKALEEETNQIEKELVRSSQVFSDFENIRKTTWIDIRNSLKPGEAAIEFIDFRFKNYSSGEYLDFSDSVLYCAIIITPACEYPMMVPLFFEHQLQDMFGRFQMNNLRYITSLYGKNDAANTALYDLIWKPLELYLNGVSTVYYSPSGLLHKVSISSIGTGKNVYLCDKYELRMQSSTAEVIKKNTFNITGSSTVSLFGGIEYNSSHSESQIWEFLPGTMTEIEKIAEIAISYQVNLQKHSGKEAEESIFKTGASKSNILHVSTHGYFYGDPQSTWKSKADNEMKDNLLTVNRASRSGTTGFGVDAFVLHPNPLMRSGLVLAGANDVWNSNSEPVGEDGVLTALEVSHIDLRKTELVVLSACETGLGDIHGSEGVYGLQRAFKMAGVHYIIMSLWKVADKETEEFMTSFYRNLFDLNDVRMAFDKTQHEMRLKYDPYFWAAFVLVE